MQNDWREIQIFELEKFRFFGGKFKCKINKMQTAKGIIPNFCWKFKCKMHNANANANAKCKCKQAQR